MFTCILVGVDGDEGGRDAIAVATRLLAPGGRLTLACVYAGDIGRYRGSSADYDAAGRADALGVLERERGEAGVEAELRPFGAPSAGQGLHELAESLDADLLVVGSTRRGLLGRVLIGDDTSAALSGAPCAVAVAPAGYARSAETIAAVGVAYNGSPESRQALEVGREIAAELGATLSACEVVSLPMTALTSGPLPLSDAVSDLTIKAGTELGGLGVAEPTVVHGHPAEELAAYSDRVGLLVVGSRSYGPVGRLVYGSIAHALARTCRSPLLVITRGTRPQPSATTTTHSEDREPSGVS